MSMKWIIAGVVAVVVIAGGAGAYVMLSGDDQANSEQAALVSSETKGATAEQASIEELLTRNASLKCSYNVRDGESTNTGTAYFSGGKNMYGEFTNTTTDTSMTAYVIRNADTQYVWQKDAKTGYKADVSAFTKEKQQQMSQQFDPSQKYKFACVDWDTDESRFTPPSTVTFTDISAQTQQLIDKLKNR